MVDLSQDATARGADRPEHDIDIDAELAAFRLTRLCGTPVSAAKIRKWASRGHVHRTGQRGRAALYSLTALETYAFSLYDPA